MFNLAAIGLAGAIRTIQLVDARDGGPRPATDVVDANFATAFDRLSKKLEGRTQRQKNPHAPGSLAFVAARLGGWNCYYKPPGPKTMRDGWNRLAATLEGYALARGRVAGGDPGWVTARTHLLRWSHPTRPTKQQRRDLNSARRFIFGQNGVRLKRADQLKSNMSKRSPIAGMFAGT
jgi:hypothetical protein